VGITNKMEFKPHFPLISQVTQHVLRVTKVIVQVISDVIKLVAFSGLVFYFLIYLRVRRAGFAETGQQT
jgi:hypothetical protein